MKKFIVVKATPQSATFQDANGAYVNLSAFPVNSRSGFACETGAEAVAHFGLTRIVRTPPPPKPPTVPVAVTPRQLRLQLLKIGITQAMVLSLIEANPDVVQREASLIEWEHALDIRRDHPLVAGLAAGLGIATEEEIDSLFIEASKL